MFQELYHGTSLESAYKICKTSDKIDFKKSCKETEWLGPGVYFFDSFNSAKDWGVKVRKFKEVCVVKALIIADDEYVFDIVSNKEHIEIFKKMCLKVKSKYEKIMNNDKRDNYIAPAIKFLYKNKRYDVIRAFFEMKTDFYKNVGDEEEFKKYFPIQTGRIQICVINLACIKKCEVVEVEK